MGWVMVGGERSEWCEKFGFEVRYGEAELGFGGSRT